MPFRRVVTTLVPMLMIAGVNFAGDTPGQKRVYSNRLTKIENPRPILADHPEFFEPIIEQAHFEAPAIVTDEGADLHVRAWRFSYNARGIIEMPNHLRSEHTALICVHPWGIDDGQGWRDCFSASSAMLAAYWHRIGNENAYNQLRQRYGDSTSAEAQLSALRQLGLQAGNALLDVSLGVICAVCGRRPDQSQAKGGQGGEQLAHEGRGLVAPRKQ